MMLFRPSGCSRLVRGTIAAFYRLAPRFRLWVLAVSSLGFYAVSGILDFFLLMGTILVSYFLSKQVRQGGSKWPIYVAVLLLIASLAYFKYGDFAYENVRNWLGGAAWVDRPRFLATILPLGITFYTFQIIGYLVDLRAGKAEQTRSLLEFTVFVTFFAPLIAGSIT